MCFAISDLSTEDTSDLSDFEALPTWRQIQELFGFDPCYPIADSCQS